MKLADSGRAGTAQDGVTLIEQLIVPTLELCKRLERERKILAGGPVVGSVALALILEAESAQKVDELVSSLPVWPRMETIVIPLTSFDGRRASVGSLAERLKARMQARPDAP